MTTAAAVRERSDFQRERLQPAARSDAAVAASGIAAATAHISPHHHQLQQLLPSLAPCQSAMDDCSRTPEITNSIIHFIHLFIRIRLVQLLVKTQAYTCTQ